MRPRETATVDEEPEGKGHTTVAEVPPGHGVIRVARRNAVLGAVRLLTVVVDGSDVGRLWAWGTRTYVVPTGHHVVRLRGPGAMWSADVVVEVHEGQTVRLRTWSKARRLPFSWKGLVTFALNPLGVDWPSLWWSQDPFGLWGNPKPEVTFGEHPRAKGPVRFDAVFIAPPSPREMTVADAAVIRRIEGATFGQERSGYDPARVDSFLQTLADRIRAGNFDGSDAMPPAPFGSAWRGYSRHDVDVFLRALAAAHSRETK
jgi:hypothetical protein